MPALHKRQMMILNTLMETLTPVTAQKLAEQTGTSVRTVKSDIAVIGDIIAQYGCCICSKAGIGYRLQVDSEEGSQILMSMVTKTYGQLQQDTPSFNYERIRYIIRKLLVQENIKIEELAEELYVSRSTLTQDLREIRKLLEAHRIKVVSRANYGMTLSGNEIDKRRCIVEYFFHSDMGSSYSIETATLPADYAPGANYDCVKRMVEKASIQHQLSLSEFSVNNFAIHILVLLQRCARGYLVQVPEEMWRRLQGTVEYKAATELLKLLEEHFGVALPPNEGLYLCMHFQSKCIASRASLDDEAASIIDSCMSAILLEIRHNFGLELELDKELCGYLTLHIPQMVTRLHNHMVIRNPLAAENVRRYLFATKITHSAAAIIEHYYDVALDANEFGYLVLYFHMALRKYENTQRIHIGLLSGRGRPETIMYLNEIKEHFPSSRYDIVILENSRTLQPLPQKVDLLVSTYRLHSVPDIPVVTIEDDCYIENMRHALTKLQFSRLDFSKYFREEFSYMGIPGTAKDEVLGNLFKRFVEVGILDRHPSDKECFAENELGNGIVHLQDLHRICRKGVCFVAVLRRPVLWKHEVVSIIVLTKTKKDGDADLYALCDCVSRWASRRDLVDSLIEKQEYDVFFDGIRAVCALQSQG